MNRLLLALTVAGFGIPPVSGEYHMAFIPLLVMAGLAAASAAAQGIAGAVQNQSNLDAQAAQNQQNRALQLKLAKQQLEEQKRQQQMSLQQDARQNIISSLQDNMNQEHASAARQQGASSDIQGALAKAFLGGGR